MPKIRPEAQPFTSNKNRRYKKAASLLQKWINESDGYDDKVWPLLELELRDSAMRCSEPTRKDIYQFPKSTLSSNPPS